MPVCLCMYLFAFNNYYLTKQILWSWCTCHDTFARLNGVINKSFPSVIPTLQRLISEEIAVTFSCRCTRNCALKGKVQVTKVHIFVHWKVRLKWPKYTYLCTEKYGWNGQSTHFCTLKSTVEMAKVHIFVHLKVRLKWPKYTYLCSRGFKRH
jgi:hypothetical protein